MNAEIYIRLGIRDMIKVINWKTDGITFCPDISIFPVPKPPINA